MCLELTKWHHRIPKFTVFGKTVYKTGRLSHMGTTFRAEYYRFLYWIGKVVQTEMYQPRSIYTGSLAIFEGFHSYQTYENADFTRALFDSDIAQFRIPAFSKYYSARDHVGRKLYASNKIQFVKGLNL